MGGEGGAGLKGGARRLRGARKATRARGHAARVRGGRPCAPGRAREMTPSPLTGGPQVEGRKKGKKRSGEAPAGPIEGHGPEQKKKKARVKRKTLCLYIKKNKDRRKEIKEIHMGSKIHIKICLGIHMNSRIFRK